MSYLPPQGFPTVGTDLQYHVASRSWSLGSEDLTSYMA